MCTDRRPSAKAGATVAGGGVFSIALRAIAWPAVCASSERSSRPFFAPGHTPSHDCSATRGAFASSMAACAAWVFGVCMA